MRQDRYFTTKALIIGASSVALFAFTANAQEVADPPTLVGHRELGSLKNGDSPYQTSPGPDLTGIVKNTELAIVLGKALFWDQQAGSDKQACASCHFRAGADPRFVHQLNPGLLGGDSFFDATATGGGGSNYKLKAGDFPFLKFADPEDRDSEILHDVNDTVSSQGTNAGEFLGFHKRKDVCGDSDSTIFHADNSHVPHPAFEGEYVDHSTSPARKVEPRNTPTVINSGFNIRNFWDGRANFTFNGVDPFGHKNTLARVVKNDGVGGTTTKLSLPRSSLASQAVGPPLSDFEMSCAGRTFPDLGARMLPLRALQFQKVHANDSVLAPYRHSSGTGLDKPYQFMIEQAFEDEFWNLPGTYTIDGTGNLVPDGSGFTQTQLNFAMLWGIAIQLYEATLVSDVSAFDKFFDGDVYALSDLQKDGLEVFEGKGNCIACHDGPLLSKAASTRPDFDLDGQIERMLMGNDKLVEDAAIYDNGFYNIGVTPTAEDIGVGGGGPFGNPLSLTRQFVSAVPPCTPGFSTCVDNFEQNPCEFEIPFAQVGPCNPNYTPSDIADHRVAVDGAFKVPSLRNVALTAPYFHNGGQATLEQVVEFYNRGGDRQGNCPSDTTSTDGKCNVDPDIQRLELTSHEQKALVAFMKSLTDKRVACESAPFDHPALSVSNGHLVVDKDHNGRADDRLVFIPAIGAKGWNSCHINSGNLFNERPL